MAFNSFAYFIFLPVVYLVFYFIGDHGRWILLLLASVAFYAALKVPYLLAVLCVIIIFNYAIGILMADSSDVMLKKMLFWGGVIGNILTLTLLKYLPFITRNINAGFGSELIVGKGLVSVGVSYFTFQAISYLADIYLEIEEPERHLGYFAVYMTFFPKLLQGPIERAGDLLPQLKRPYEFHYDNMRTGMLMFTWGLFKKVVVADRLALFVDPVYNNVHSFTGLNLVLATYLYAFQIYFDFAGYTDMALGTARMFNIKLTNNFNNPYLATSVADFWRRWHISFSRWILDYIFKPLQMCWRDLKAWGTVSALIITFIVSGVWHGASWGFVVWGVLHGIYLSMSVLYKKALPSKFKVDKSRLFRALQVIITFNLVCFAWIFFRANSLSDAFYVVKNMLHGIGNINAITQNQNTHFCIVSVALAIIATIHVLIRTTNITVSFYKSHVIVRWIPYLALIMLIMLFNYSSDKQFIYMQF